NHRLDPGERDAEAHPPSRRLARRTAPPLRRSRDDARRSGRPSESRLSGLRRFADDHRVHRLRRVLQRAGASLMPAVRIPPTLRADVGGARELEAEGSTVAEVIEDLIERYPLLAGQLLHGELAPFVNVYVGGEDVRTRDGLDTEVRNGDQLILLPAMAGGSSPADPDSRRAEPGSAGV